MGSGYRDPCRCVHIMQSSSSIHVKAALDPLSSRLLLRDRARASYKVFRSLLVSDHRSFMPFLPVWPCRRFGCSFLLGLSAHPPIRQCASTCGLAIAGVKVEKPFSCPAPLVHEARAHVFPRSQHLHVHLLSASLPASAGIKQAPVLPLYIPGLVCTPDGRGKGVHFPVVTSDKLPSLVCPGSHGGPGGRPAGRWESIRGSNMQIAPQRLLSI